MSLWALGCLVMCQFACESSDPVKRTPVVAANYATDSVTGKSFTFDPNAPRDNSFDKIDTYFYPLNPPAFIGQQKFSSVNAAVDSAQAGDTVWVAKGIYDQPLVIQGKKDLTILAKEAPAYFLIPVNNQPVAQLTNAENIELVNLYFRHDMPPGTCKGTFGSTMVIQQSKDITLDHCYLNGSGYHGIWSDGISGALALQEIIIEECYLEAIMIEKGNRLDRLVIDKCLISNKSGIQIKSPQKDMTFAQITKNHFNAPIGNYLEKIIEQQKGASEVVVADNLFQTAPEAIQSTWSWKPDPRFIHSSADSAAIFPLINQGLIDASPVPVRGALSLFYPAKIERIPDWVTDGGVVFAPCFNGNLTPVKLKVAVRNELSCDLDSAAFYFIEANCPTPFFIKNSPFPLGEIPLPTVERLGDYHWRLFLKGKPYDLRMLRSNYADGKNYGETASYNVVFTSNEGARHLYHFSGNPRYMDRPGLSWAGDINHDGSLDLWINLGMAEGSGNLGLFLSHTDKTTGKVTYMVVYVPIEVTIC